VGWVATAKFTFVYTSGVGFKDCDAEIIVIVRSWSMVKGEGFSIQFRDKGLRIMIMIDLLTG